MSLIALHFDLRFLEVHFSMLTLFLVGHFSSNPQKIYMQIFETLRGRASYWKYKMYIFLIISQLLGNFALKIGMYTNKKAF